jgi:hypothetical protein
VGTMPALSSATLPAPFDTAPFTTDCTGNCASRDSGGFFQKPSAGFTSLVYFVGTNITAGSLILDFALPFGNGEGKDFAILTSSESWGSLANIALFEFFLDGTLVGSFRASLAPDRLFEFELPGDNIIANRIVITNITPGPPGINDLATMTFIDAGVAHPIPSAPPCTLNLTASVTDGTLTLDFDVGTHEPATWNVWLIAQAEITEFLSATLPRVDPPIPVHVSIPFFPSLGTIGILTTFTTPDQGIICSVFKTVNTRSPTRKSASMVHEFSNLFWQYEVGLQELFK